MSLEGSQSVRLKQHFGLFPAFHEVFVEIHLQSLVGLRMGFLQAVHRLTGITRCDQCLWRPETGTSGSAEDPASFLPAP